MKPFDDTSIFDELRRHAQGEMSAEERARFAAELARDPERARLAAEFQTAWAATESAFLPAVTSRVRFDTLVPHIDHDDWKSTWGRRAAAALFVFALAAIGWMAWRSSRAVPDEFVELRVVPWRPAALVSAEDKAVPALLSNWSPIQDGQIRWLESMDEARAVSAAVSRPIFVYGYIETCPICQGFQRNEFQDPEILSLVDQTVPVRIDLMQIEAEEAQAIFERRYPLLEMQDQDGTILHTFPGTFAEVDMRAELSRTVAGIAGPNWKLVHDLAQAYLAAKTAESTGRLAEAAAGFGTLAGHGELPRFAEVGSAGLSRLAAEAARALEDARVRATRGDHAALADFETRVRGFAGTPFEAELNAVADSWRAHGRFPRLKPVE